jgi:putative transposase
MTDYRRNFVAGGSFFFTVNLAERHRQLLMEHIDELRGAFRQTRERHPFTTDAIVVLLGIYPEDWAGDVAQV